MVLNFTALNKHYMEDAKLFTVAGQIPIPTEYQNGTFYKAELLMKIVTCKKEQKPEKFENTVVIQFSNSIYAFFMFFKENEEGVDSDTKYYTKLNQKEIVKLRMIRDHN